MILRTKFGSFEKINSVNQSHSKDFKTCEIYSEFKLKVSIKFPIDILVQMLNN